MRYSYLHFNIPADKVVPHKRAGSQRFRYVDNALIFGAAEGKADIFLFLDKFAVHEDINTGKHFISHFAAGAAFGEQIAFQRIAAVAPYRFIGICGADSF